MQIVLENSSTNINCLRKYAGKINMKDNRKIVAEEEEEQPIGDDEEDEESVDLVIKSLKDYDNIISNIDKRLKNKFKNKNDHYSDFFQTFYRGQANKSFLKMPSVFRNGLHEKEHLIIDEAQNEYPYEFSHVDTNFELIAKLQHYGGATRLLDFTFDPYIALYFACKGFKSDDGEIVIYRSACVPQNDICIQTLSLFAKYHSSYGKLCDYLRKGLKQIYSDEFLLNLVKGSYFVLPALSNERIFRQKGVFLMFGQKYISGNNNKVKKQIHELSDTIGRGRNYIGGTAYIKIPYTIKAQILFELKQKGIYEEYLFPELDKGLRMINEKYIRK